MEIFSKEIQVGNIILELSIHEIEGTKRVVITAKDEENRRLWRTPILQNGEIKTYNSNQDAIEDAEKKIASL
jgi:hypothetical protein